MWFLCFFRKSFLIYLFLFYFIFSTQIFVFLIILFFIKIIKTWRQNQKEWQGVQIRAFKTKDKCLTELRARKLLPSQALRFALTVQVFFQQPITSLEMEKPYFTEWLHSATMHKQNAFIFIFFYIANIDSCRLIGGTCVTCHTSFCQVFTVVMLQNLI